MSSEINNNNAGEKNIFPEKDVLGLEKTAGSSTTTAKPNRIFIALAVLIVIAILYWLFTGK